MIDQTTGGGSGQSAEKQSQVAEYEIGIYGRLSHNPANMNQEWRRTPLFNFGSEGAMR